MTVKLPKTIRVGLIDYTVTQDRDTWVQYEHQIQHNGAYGYTDHTTARILLSPDLADTVVPLTLWHEVLHAVCESLAGAPEWTKLGKDKGDREEAVIRRLESPTMQVLRDNPKLVKLMTKIPA